MKSIAEESNLFDDKLTDSIEVLSIDLLGTLRRCEIFCLREQYDMSKHFNDLGCGEVHKNVLRSSKHSLFIVQWLILIVLRAIQDGNKETASVIAGKDGTLLASIFSDDTTNFIWHEEVNC